MRSARAACAEMGTGKQMLVSCALALLTGCAALLDAPVGNACPAPRYDAGYAAGYAYGKSRGRMDLLEELRSDAAFSVSALALDGFDNRNPWLPDSLVVKGITYRRAVRRGNETRQSCATRLDAAQRSIYQMLERVRGPQ